VSRCFGDGDPLYERYHDEEWGRPQTSERALYEKVCLEGFQAGLAWITVLRKREALREVFAASTRARRRARRRAAARRRPAHPVRAEAAGVRDQRPGDAGAARARRAARAAVERRRGAVTGVRRLGDVPASTPPARRSRSGSSGPGFVFVGPTTVYSLLQACGLVDDHLTTCPVRDEVEGCGRR
jgi:DNA-3-methyladenine glycosylase I